MRPERERRATDRHQETIAPMETRSRRRSYRAVKRVIDATVAAAVLTAGAPVMAACAVAIRVTMGAPVLFRQPRPGLHGRPFEILKFRTMRAPRAGENELATDAARLTALGRFLRETSLDELPQLWNVLRGDMSLVGPRPLLMQYLPRYSREQRRRHDVRPGMTGWTQVNGRNALTWDEKFTLDVWYVDHQSLALDLRILAQTVLGVVRRDGISSGGHATMPEFLGTDTLPS
jgi:lipopolysaccharide/colanic/teichoic acid biosynthesis glycosyltransferase